MAAANPTDVVRPALGDPTSRFKDDYASAEITAAYVRETKTNERHLVLAVVELLTQWHEQSPEQEECEDLGGNTDLELNLRRWHRPVDEAVSWYRRLSTSGIPASKHRPGTPLAMSAGPFVDEPRWPSLVFQQHDYWTRTGVAAKRPGGVRVHHQLRQNAGTVIADLPPAARERAIQFLKDKGGFDFVALSPMVGTAHLVLPNPVFHNIEKRLVDIGKNELAVSIELLPGQTTSTLSLLLREARLDGPTVCQMLPVPSQRFVVELPHPPHLIATDIVCSLRGLIYSTEPATFIRSIQLSTGIGTGERTVTVDRRDGRRDSYSVSTIGHRQRTIAGATEPVPAIHQLAEAMNLTPTEPTSVRWFRDQQPEAATFVRSLIERGERRVLIVDPYFDAECLYRFALANATHGVAVRILSSRMGLKRSPGNVDADGLPLLREHVGRIAAVTSSNAVSVRLMLGKSPLIHDRFVVVDDELWLVGSSLNELGNRGTCVTRVSDGGEILADLETAWSEASPLEAASVGTEET